MYLSDVSFCIFFFKQKTAYEMRISDWSSDVCSSDLGRSRHPRQSGPWPTSGVPCQFENEQALSDKRDPTAGQQPRRPGRMDHWWFLLQRSTQDRKSVV